jgi:hypothetical protein
MTKDKAEMVYCALGKFVAAVSRLDLVMGHLLEAITQLNPGIARSIYLSQDSVSARRAIVDQAAANALHDPTQLENYREISSTVADLMARRNRFLHDIWLSDEQTGDPTLFSMKVLNKNEAVLQLLKQGGDDAVAALKVVKAMPDIDPKKVFLMGFSAGATASLYATDPKAPGAQQYLTRAFCLCGHICG